MVPQIVMDLLKMPDAFAGAGIQRQGGVCIQVGTRPIRPVKIGSSRAKARKQNAAFCIQSKAWPGIHAAALFPAIFLPGFVAGLSGPGNRMETPHLFASAHIKGPDIARSPGLSLGYQITNIDEILEDYWRGGYAIGHAPDIALDSNAQIQNALFAKVFIWLSGSCIQRDKAAIRCAHKHAALAAFAAIGPVSYPPVNPSAVRVVAPYLLARCGVQGHHFQAGGGEVHNAIHHHGAALYGASGRCIAAMIAPHRL